MAKPTSYVMQIQSQTAPFIPLLPPAPMREGFQEYQRQKNVGEK